jgi:uncharacterized protein
MNSIYNLLLGITFGSGLILSKSFEPTTIIAFLNWTENWNPSLLYTIIGMMLVSGIFFFFEKKFNLTDGFFITKDKQIDLNAEVIIGAILFGIGWSISGLCVSTATVNLAFGHSQSTLFFLFMIIGFYCPQFFKKIIL